MFSVSPPKSTSPRSLKGVVTGGSIPWRSMFDIFTRPTFLGGGLFQSAKLNWDYRWALIEGANEGSCKAETGWRIEDGGSMIESSYPQSSNPRSSILNLLSSIFYLIIRTIFRRASAAPRLQIPELRLA